MKQNINKISILKHSNNIRVYYEDTDAGGLVYHANYLKFAERARTEMLRKMKIEQLILKNEYNIQFVVKNLFIEFFKSAQLDDLLNIKSLLFFHYERAGVLFSLRALFADWLIISQKILATLSAVLIYYMLRQKKYKI